MKAALHILILVFGVLNVIPAAADESDAIVHTVCDAETNTVVVDVGYGDLAQSPPEGKSYDAYSLPTYIDNKRPFLLCDFGKNRVVSIKVGLSPEHPRNNNAAIYINNSRIPAYLSFGEAAVKVSFSANGDAKYCVGENTCATSIPQDGKESSTNTKPSFDCSKALTAVEKVTCSDPWLPAYDLLLAASYSELVAQAGDAAALRLEQRTWLKSRASECHLPDSGVLPTNFDDAKAADCLSRLYDARTIVLNKMGARLVGLSDFASRLMGKWSDGCVDDAAARSDLGQPSDSPHRHVLKSRHSASSFLEMEVSKNDDDMLRISLNRDLLEFKEDGGVYIVSSVAYLSDGKIQVSLIEEADLSSKIHAIINNDGDRILISSVIGDDGYVWVRDAKRNPSQGITEIPWISRCEH